MAPTDPFYLVRDDIQSSVDKAQAQFSRWRSINKTSSERQKLEEQVEDECKSIAWQVDEMEKAVDVAEQNMARFGLSKQEIAARRKWVNQTRQQCEALVAGLRAPEKQPRAAPASASNRLGAAVQQDNDRFLGSEEEQQQQLIRRQDEDLDMLGDHVVRIGQVGRQIHEELNQQGDLLDELDTDIDGTSTRLAAAQKKMNHVLQKAGLRGQLCIIGVLLVLLVVLILIAFS